MLREHRLSRPGRVTSRCFMHQSSTAHLAEPLGLGARKLLRARKSKRHQKVLNILETTLLINPEAEINTTDTGFYWATRSAVLTCKRAQDALCEKRQLPGLHLQNVRAGVGRGPGTCIPDKRPGSPMLPAQWPHFEQCCTR